MLQDLRIKIAQTASGIITPEVFPWTRWLKKPKVKLKKIEKLRLAHLNTDEVILIIDKTPIENHTTSLEGNGIITQETHYELAVSKCSIVFFNFGRTKTGNIDIVYNEAGKILYSALYHNKNNLIYWTTSFNEDKPKIMSETQAEFEIQFIITSYVADTRKLKYLLEPTKKSTKLPAYLDHLQADKDNIEDIKFDILIPKIINSLSKLIPKIYNIKLLMENLSSSVEQEVKVFNQDELNKLKPNVYRIKLLRVNEAQIKKFYLKNIELVKNGIWGHFPIYMEKPFVFEKEYFIENDPTEIIYTNSENEAIDEFSDSSKQLNNLISNILNPHISVISDESSLNIFKHIQTGKEFLLQNKYALLADELGIDKKLQALLALKELFNRGKIKNVLIAVNENEIGPSVQNPLSLESWFQKINTIFPNIKTSVITDNNNNELLFPAPITIIGHNSLLEILAHNGNNNIAIGNFDAVIFEDIEILLNELSNSTAFLNKTSPVYFWALTALPLSRNYDILKRVLNMLDTGTDSISTFRREIEEVANELTANPQINYVINSDIQQQVEYLELLDKGIIELLDFQISGNPYRFHANVFTLLHQLIRVNNFAGNSDSSNKARFLISVINKIAASNKKAVIFVMDEKYAAEKIENLFSSNKLDYTSFYSGRTPEELNDSINKFTTQKDITAFLIGIKSIKGKLKLPSADYIIYFDKWWNPASMWQLESSVFSKTSTKNLNHRSTRILLNTANTLDTIIQSEIIKKKFYDELLFEAIPPELLNEIFSDREWMKILNSHAQDLGLNPERSLDEEIEEKEISDNAINSVRINIPQISKDEVLGLVKNFIKRINYTNIKIRVSSDENVFEIEATNNKNARYNQIYSLVLFDEVEDELDLQRTLSNKIQDKHGLKIIVFQLYEDTGNSIIKGNDRIAIIDLSTFAGYLHHLKIY